MSEINYVDDLIQDLSDNGFTQELKDLLDNDTQFLSDLNVSNDQERNLAFYLDHFCDDICKEFGYNIKDKKPVIVKSFNYLKGLDDIDLTKIRAAVLKSLRELNRKKVAYPNISGVGESNLKPKRDISKWVQALAQIYIATKSGENRKNAVERITEEWSPMEKNDFEAWARYYEKGDYEKYNIKNASYLDLQQLLNDNQEEIEQPDPPIIKKEKTLDDYKKTLLSRLNSAERLLYNFVHVWPDQVYNRLHQGLSDLKREITMMRTTASMQDVIIRTASIWEYNGFIEGANELRKIAAPPGDITSEIEKALTGREFEDYDKPVSEDVPKGDVSSEMMPPSTDTNEMPNTEMAEMPEIGPSSEELGAPPAGVEEPLPPEEPLPNPEPEKVSQENPFSSATVQDVLDILNPLSQKFREREFIRGLSKADMMLDALNIASHFPELGEAQAKALELNIYVGSRIEKVINKLKGGLKEDEEESKTNPPNIEMGELEGKGPEETAFEVTEEEAPIFPRISKTPETPTPETPTPEVPKTPEG